MDNRDKTNLDLEKLAARDKAEAAHTKPAVPSGVPMDGADIEAAAQHAAPHTVEEFLKSLEEADAQPKAAETEGPTPHPPPAGHVHFRVAPPRANESGHFP
jgi:hypothetical protein